MVYWAEFEDCEVLAESDVAILVAVSGRKEWIPKSQISDDSSVYEMGTSGCLIITQWLAEQKGLV